MNQLTVVEGQYLAVFNSTHRVLKAEALLKNIGIPIMLIPAPRAVQADCGLALRFDQDYRERVIQLLGSHHLLPAFLCQLLNGQYIIHKEFNHEDH